MFITDTTPADDWEVTYPRSDIGDEPFEQVSLRFLDFAQIDESWSPDERASLARRVGRFVRYIDRWDQPDSSESEGEPPTIAYECNRLAADGTWWRSAHGVKAGRHRLVAARTAGRSYMWAKIVEKHFLPRGARPPDRADIGPGIEGGAADTGHAHRHEAQVQ